MAGVFVTGSLEVFLLAAAFQAEYEGSIPFTRSITSKLCLCRNKR